MAGAVSNLRNLLELQAVNAKIFVKVLDLGHLLWDTGYFPTPKTGHFPTPKNGYFPTRVLQNLIVIETQISTKKGNGHFPTQLPQKLMTGM